MAEVVEKVEEFLGIHKASDNTFLKMATSIPLLSDTVSYAKDEYVKIKNKNHLFDAFMNGVERSVTRATFAAFDISKSVVPYKYIDDLACKGLKKIEEKYPVIKKPTKEVWNECSNYALSTISGMHEKKKLPNSLSEAIGDRISLVVIKTSNKMMEIKCVRMLSSGAHQVLDKWENMIEIESKSKGSKGHKKKRSKTKTENLLKRIFELTSKAKLQLQIAAQEIADLKGEIREAEKLSMKDMWNVTERWLTNLYAKLRNHPSNEGILQKTLRLCGLTIVGGLLQTIKVVDATLPKLKSLIKNIFALLKKALLKIGHIIKNSSRQICQNLKRMIHKIKNSIIQIIKIIKHIFWVTRDNLMKTEQNFVNEFVESSPSVAGPSSSLHGSSNQNDMVGATPKDE